MIFTLTPCNRAPEKRAREREQERERERRVHLWGKRAFNNNSVFIVIIQNSPVAGRVAVSNLERKHNMVSG